MDYKKLADLIYPNITKTPDDYEQQFPQRNLPEGAYVTRFAPSPTGFLHLGHVYGAIIDRFAAHSSKGVFYLRIEDTDKQREVENGVKQIIDTLAEFELLPDEGYQPNGSVLGEYGPYLQSERCEIYQCFAKSLIEKGLAYPCFCTKDDLDEMRKTQEENGDMTGYHGKFARCRDLSYDEVKENLDKGLPFVIRLKSAGVPDGKIAFTDVVKGKIEMQENFRDEVLIKANGIPPYAFAHAVDDHLMRTTHVVRGDEWLPSTPTHIEIHKALGFKTPKYIHIAPIMKEENGSKRKLSKRKDPEAAVVYFLQEGFPIESFTEYLMTLANSNFEDWRKANKDSDISQFPFSFKKMSVSGALFDYDKLLDVSKNVISRYDAENVYNLTLNWAKKYDTDFAKILEDNEQKAKSFLAIGRGGKKPRKDFAKWSEVKDFSSYMFNELYTPCFEYPENISKDDVSAILNAYSQVYSVDDDNTVWFDKVKSICEPLGFSPDVKAYKAEPDKFKGHVGDVSTVIRVAITGRTNTPDLCTIMGLLGEQTVTKRIKEHL